MALGDIKLTFTLPLSAFGGQVRIGDATTGTVHPGATTGTVS